MRSTLWKLQYLNKIKFEHSMSKRKPLFKKEEDEGFEMTDKNIKICLDNQDRYFTPEINDALELHYYGFYQISNLEAFTNLNTLYLQNNVIARI